MVPLLSPRRLCSIREKEPERAAGRRREKRTCPFLGFDESPRSASSMLPSRSSALPMECALAPRRHRRLVFGIVTRGDQLRIKMPPGRPEPPPRERIMRSTPPYQPSLRPALRSDPLAASLSRGTAIFAERRARASSGLCTRGGAGAHAAFEQPLRRRKRERPPARAEPSE